jgi:hypothetical protein
MPFSGAARTTLNVERAQHVQAEVFDSFGRRLLVIHDGYVQDGASLNLVIDAAALASGVYVLRVSGQTFKATRTAVVAK